ncbi:MAG: right-handed parallel beta-helix repeat-containing protein [Verrucomicrobia bacterium]|nr:right-handed parallel beta-helix repeat-containing protein [Verrucomicrobiota bacterium]
MTHPGAHRRLWHLQTFARSVSTARSLAALAWAVVTLGVAAVASAAEPAGGGVFEVRDFGAVGDGIALDTAAIQRAVDACAAAGGGQVRLSPGRYLSGTVHLGSDMTFWLEAGATLVGTTNLGDYAHPTPPAFLPEARWGKWHRALLLAVGARNLTLAGQGTIDGNRVFDPTGEERMRGPHAFVFVSCAHVTVRDVTFLDAANYAIFFQVSDEVEVRHVKFIGGWDGVHWRGAPERWCHHVRIVGCQFHTGDDAIAGRYWADTLISGCVINSSCNGLRLIGPATRLRIHDCLFYGPGERPHRTSNRHNMLAGINLQPGAWDPTRGPLDDVLISDVTMHDVSTPFHISLKPGNTAGRIVVNRVSATGVYRAASSVESWAETPITNAVFRDVTIATTGGGTAEQAARAVKAPGVDARPLPAWGFYARHVERLELDNVRLRLDADDRRPVLLADRVGTLVLEGFRFPAVPGVDVPMVLTNVTRVERREPGAP